MSDPFKRILVLGSQWLGIGPVLRKDTHRKPGVPTTIVVIRFKWFEFQRTIVLPRILDYKDWSTVRASGFLPVRQSTGKILLHT